MILFDAKYRALEFSTSFTGNVFTLTNYSLAEVIKTNLGDEAYGETQGVVILAKTGSLIINLLGILIPSGGQTNMVLRSNNTFFANDSFLTLYSKVLLNKVNIARVDATTEANIICLTNNFR